MRSATAIVYFTSVVLFTTVRSQFECPSVCSCTLPSPGNGLIDCSNRGLTEVLAVYHPGASHIQKVDFSNNMLTTLDIDKLYSLIRGFNVNELDFSSNSITVVNGTFDGTVGRDFETLNLSNNAFTIFPENVIPRIHLTSRFVLDFSYNQLTELTANMFASGDDTLFSGFQFLARNNMINRIDNDAFQGLDLVDTILDLRNNQLRTLSPSFQGPRGVEAIRLSGNPWECDCNLRWIIDPNRFLINYTSSDPPNCQTPVSLRGRPLFHLKENEFTCLPYRAGSLQREIQGTDTFTLTCPVTADPPNPEISWTVWLPCPNEGDPLRFYFTSETVTLSDITTNPRAAFRCTATNNAGSVDLDLDILYEGERGIPIPDSSTKPAATQQPFTFQPSGGQSTTIGNGQISMGPTATERPGGRPVGAIIVLVILLFASWLVIGILIFLILKLRNKSKQEQTRKHAKDNENRHSGVTEPAPITYSNVNRSNGRHGAAVHPEPTTPTYAAPDKGRTAMKPTLPVKPPIPGRPAPPPKTPNRYQYNTEEYDDPPLKFGLYNGGYDYNNRDSVI